MSQARRAAFAVEMTLARAQYAAGRLDVAFRHMERAHILGQLNLIDHLVSHWWMLKVGLRRLEAREVVGQVLRLFASFIGAAFAWVPLGNTGGANVSPLHPMPLPPEFLPLFAGYDGKRAMRRRLATLRSSP